MDKIANWHQAHDWLRESKVDEAKIEQLGSMVSGANDPMNKLKDILASKTNALTEPEKFTLWQIFYYQALDHNTDAQMNLDGTFGLLPQSVDQPPDELSMKLHNVTVELATAYIDMGSHASILAGIVAKETGKLLKQAIKASIEYTESWQN